MRLARPESAGSPAPDTVGIRSRTNCRRFLSVATVATGVVLRAEQKSARRARATSYALTSLSDTLKIAGKEVACVVAEHAATGRTWYCAGVPGRIVQRTWPSEKIVSDWKNAK
jgi:hypothetical protein